MVCGIATDKLRRRSAVAVSPISDYEAGAKYAVERGWIEFNGTTIRLLKDDE